MPTEQELRLVARLQGFDSAAKEVEKVGDAQAKVTEKTKEAKPPVDELGDAQEKLKSSNEDFVSLLGRIHPSLGAMADAMSKGSKIAGDFANKQIDLNAITKKVTSTFVENAGAIKLLGAAGIAALGFTALARAIAFVVEESRKLREELDALKERKTAEQEEVIAGGREVTTISRRRHEDGFTGEQQAQAEDIYADIMRLGRIRDDLIPTLKTNVAALAGILEAPEIERLTMAGVQIDPELRPETRERRARRALEDADVQAAWQRERDAVRMERQRRATEAMREATSEDPLAGLARFKELFEELDIAADPKDVRAALQQFDAIVKSAQAGKAESGWLWQWEGKPDEMMRGMISEAVAQQLGFWGRGARFRRGEESYTEEGALLEDALRKILSQAGVSAPPLPGTGGAAPEPVTINQYQYNGRYYGPDAASRKRRTVNGESRARMAEML